MAKELNSSEQDEDRWVRSGPKGRALLVENLDGVWWYDAPLPRRFHRHRAQTRTLDVERCPCGAMRMYGHGPWINRNERRRSERRKRKDRDE